MTTTKIKVQIPLPQCKDDMEPCFLLKLANQISVTRLDVVTTLDYFTSTVFGKLSKPIMMR